MALTVNTNIINDTDQYLLDAKNVKGGYVVVDSITERNALPTATTVVGTLCYCKSDSKFYLYNGTSWDEQTVVADLSSHTGNTTVHITAGERTKWNAAKTHADSAHAPSNAEKNQNAFSNIAVSGQSTVSADTTTDTLTLVAGSNVTITTDASNDKITIAATDTDTHNSHAIISGKKADGSTDIKGTASATDITLGDSGVTAGEYGPTSNQTPAYGGTFNVPDIKVNAKGIVTSVTNRTVKIPASDNTDTGATSVEVTGTGNAITDASYDATNRKITLTKGATYNNYSLPAAGSALGGVKTGGDVTISSGVITVNDDSHNHVISNIDGLQTALDGKAPAEHSHAYIPTSQKGAANGVAELDANGKVPASQLPAYVDDVLEYDKKASFPTTGETGKIYVDKDTNKTYRWSGSAYTEISASLALGTTSSTAFRGDYGNTAYQHSQAAHAPSDAQKNVQSDWNATSGDAFIKNKPTIPTVNDGTLTIQKNGTDVATFSANQSDNVTANITVPTKVSDLTNDSGFKTTDTNTTYDFAASTSSANGNVKLNLTAGGSGSGTDSVTIQGSGATTVTTDANGVVTISSTDSNTTYSSKSAVSGGTDVSLVTTGEKYTWNNKSNLTIGTTSTTAAAGNHTHSSYVNQNAFSNVKVGSTTINADTTTDTIELEGSNVTLTPDATNNKLTIGITQANVTAALGYTPPTTNTTYGVASSTTDGLMSKADKVILDALVAALGVTYDETTNTVTFS